MCTAALFSGIALANANFGMCTAWPVFWAGPLAMAMAPSVPGCFLS